MQLKRLVSDLVSLGALGSGAYRIRTGPVHLVSLIETCLEAFRDSASEKDLVLEGGVTPGTPQIIQTDEQRLRQVLEALLDNAIKYTQSGAVQVAAHRAAAPDQSSMSPGRQIYAGAWVEIRVCDTGPGIPLEKQDRLLVPYSESGNTATGGRDRIGLGIASRWCDVMGGGLWVESDGVHGTAFVVKLPIGQPSEAQSAEQGDFSPVVG